MKSGFYSYFSFAYGPGEEAIVIDLTTIAGDPDVLISTKYDVQFPTKETADIVSDSDRHSDKIKIPVSKLPTECTSGEISYCEIHIAVYCDERYGASQFSIVAGRDHALAISELINGVP